MIKIIKLRYFNILENCLIMNHFPEFSCTYNDEPCTLRCDEHKIMIAGKFEKVEFHISLNLHFKWCYEAKILTSCLIEKNIVEASEKQLSNLK